MGKVYPNKHTQHCWQLDFIVTYPTGGETFKGDDVVSVTVKIGLSGLTYIQKIDLYTKDGKYTGTLVTNEPVNNQDYVTMQFNLWLRPRIVPGEYYYSVIGTKASYQTCYATSPGFNIT